MWFVFYQVHKEDDSKSWIQWTTINTEADKMKQATPGKIAAGRSFVFEAVKKRLDVWMNQKDNILMVFGPGISEADASLVSQYCHTKKLVFDIRFKGTKNSI